MSEGDLRQFVIDLSESIREVVLPDLGSKHARADFGTAIGGDRTFGVDDIAENLISDRLDRRGDIAYYSEDRGLTVFGDPEAILVIDPVDGSRPAAAGLESCCVSIAVTEKMDNPQIGDVSFGVVQEIVSGRVFTAAKGEGFEVTQDGEDEVYEQSSVEDISQIFWTLGFRGRPAIEMATVLAELIDASSVNGAVFDLGSACFGMTRIVTGQLDTYVDVGNRMIQEVPEVIEVFKKIGGGAVLNNSPYDVAAAKLILEEAGCVVSDASGATLDHHRLLGSTHEFQLSCVASASWNLHDKVLEHVDRGIERLKDAMT